MPFTVLGKSFSVVPYIFYYPTIFPCPDANCVVLPSRCVSKLLRQRCYTLSQPLSLKPLLHFFFVVAILWPGSHMSNLAKNDLTSYLIPSRDGCKGLDIEKRSRGWLNEKREPGSRPRGCRVLEEGPKPQLLFWILFLFTSWQSGHLRVCRAHLSLIQCNLSTT